MMRRFSYKWRLLKLRWFRLRRRGVPGSVIRNVLIFYLILLGAVGLVVYGNTHPQMVQLAVETAKDATNWALTDGIEVFPRLVGKIPITDSLARTMFRQSMPMAAGTAEPLELNISEEAVRDILAAVTNYDLQRPASFFSGQISVMAVSSSNLALRSGERVTRTPSEGNQVESPPSQTVSITRPDRPEPARVTVVEPPPSGGRQTPAQEPEATGPKTPEPKTPEPKTPEPKTPGPATPEIPTIPRPEPSRQPELSQIDWGTSPLVGIYHTHTGETYRTEENVKGKSYAWDNYKPAEGPIPGVVQVGVVISEELKSRFGIPVAHSTSIHDYPIWSRAYFNSQRTAQDMVAKYQDLQLLLDIHRDEGETMTAVTGEHVSRVLIVVATSENDELPHPGWQKNLAFAQKLQSKFEELYPGLSRGIRIRRDSRFNQHLHPHALLLEVGANGDSLEQALSSGRLIAHVIAETLKEERETMGTPEARRPESGPAVPIETRN